MKILVDADACPVKNLVVRTARALGIPVILFGDTSHRLGDGYSTVVVVDKGRDSVDIALANALSKEDVVVTQDYGLAAMVLGKGARALNQNGLVYTNDNIDQLLADRHLGQKIRRAGGRTKGPPKRTQDDDDRFRLALRSMLEARSAD